MYYLNSNSDLGADYFKQKFSQDCSVIVSKHNNKKEEKIHDIRFSKGHGLHRAFFFRTWTDDLMDCGFSVMGLVGIKSMPGTTSYSRPWDAQNTQFDKTQDTLEITLPLNQSYVLTNTNRSCSSFKCSLTKAAAVHIEKEKVVFRPM